jgi:lysophospholipase L1-like esterase
MKRLLMVSGATAALALLAGPALASARPERKSLPVVPGSRYLALGDSVTFGYMEPQITPAPDYHRPASFRGYPEQVAAALHLKAVNAACPGETSSSLIKAAGPSNGCENNPGHTALNYRALFPLHVRYRGSQLGFAISYLRHHHDVRLVSLMIGANDFFACQETTHDGCQSAAERDAVAATLARNIRTILGGIRRKAHYRGQIVVVNYYSLDYASAAVSARSRFLNRLQDAPARRFHVEFANGYGAFRIASLHSSGSPCAADLLTQLGGGSCGVHPSYAGQALLADAVEKAIKLG